MPRRNNSALLRQIATIRGLQRTAAEAEAARAVSTLREKNEARGESERQRQSTEKSWRTSLSTPPVLVEIMRAWSADLLRREEVVLHATGEADEAAAELDRRATAWHVATMRYETAQSMARKAVKARARYREEIALQDASDRHARRGSVR